MDNVQRYAEALNQRITYLNNSIDDSNSKDVKRYYTYLLSEVEYSRNVFEIIFSKELEVQNV